MSVYEVGAREYNELLAEALKEIGEFRMPEWALYVKTGLSRIKPPEDGDWWYNRSASILRQIYLNDIVGVNRLRVRYGGKQNRGMKPEKFAKSSGKIIRTILQQGEEAGFLEKVDGKKKGRKLTKKGKDFLDSIKVAEKPKEKSEPIEEPKVEEKSKEVRQEVKSESTKEVTEDKDIVKEVNKEGSEHGK
jgi:small subunit ribosomal protein S19e